MVVLADGTIASGDSLGNVQLWDAAMGTRLQRFKLAADVLGLAASPTGDAVFAAGVDPAVAMFGRFPGADGRELWQLVSKQRPHSHDVRALAVVQVGLSGFCRVASSEWGGVGGVG